MPLIGSSTLKGLCPVCGQRHQTCGGPTTHVGIDQQVQEAKVSEKAEKSIYEVAGRRGQKVELKLTEAQADKLYPDAKKLRPAPKYESPRTATATVEAAPTASETKTKAAPAPATKKREAKNK